MTVELTMPPTAGDARAYRAAGTWTDGVAPGVASLAALGERTAILDHNGAMTYAELASVTERLASNLYGCGVRTGDAVVVVTDNDRESVLACHATWQLGAVAVLVHRSSGAGDVALACEAVSPAIVLLASGAEPFRAAAGFTGRVAAIADLVGTGGVSASDIVVDPDAARLVIFTSGTTSKAKGVVHTANTLRASAANFLAMTDLTADDRLFLVSPLASIAGVLQVLRLAPELGAVAVLENAWEGEGTLDFLVETGGTFYGGTDTVLARLLDVARNRGVRVPLRTISVGGTKLQGEVLKRAEDDFGIRVLRVYGLSEAPNSTGSRPNEARGLRLADDGAPAPGVELRVGPDGSGEVLVHGPHLFRGYLDPADNGDAFDGDWLRTGDLGELAQGRLRVTGRLKEIANRNGKKVSLAEVEESFRAVAMIDECAAFAVPDPLTGERVVLAVRMSEGKPLDVPAVLQAMVSSGLAKWKLPESVLRYDARFPTTATGKVRRVELSEENGALLWSADRLAKGEGAGDNVSPT
jgi:acyl-CoA synthetase (AMP-forming)/AMP-acid ligase II